MSLELLRLNKNKNAPLQEFTAMSIKAFPCPFQERMTGGFVNLILFIFLGSQIGYVWRCQIWFFISCSCLLCQAS